MAAPAAPPAPETDRPNGHEVTDGERRHLTVLFCDLVNSTEIAANLDPEEWHDIAADYQRAGAEAVTRFSGHVAKYLGDGLMAFFGYPEAHEDDAERAVRAGLAIVDSLVALNTRLSSRHNPVKLSVRVGIQTGSVVVGHGAGKETDVFGDAPNVASRVQSAAEPDSVFITAAVHQLVSGLFVIDDRGAQRLKGIAQPVQLYRVIQPSAARRRTHGAAARSLTPFVGRDDELRLALNRWERARDGEGQLALVVGEPGIGKSRLVEEFRARIKDDPHLWIECAGEQFFESTPFHAVTQILNQGLGWRGDESPHERANQLERSLELAGMKLGEAVPLIAEMLSLPIPEKYSPLMFAPDQKRKRLLANLAAWVTNFARIQPMVIAMEDLHWVDPSTLELMQMLVEQSATTPLMLLYTARPEFRTPWPMRAHHAHITLSRLNGRHTRAMVAAMTSSSALTNEVIDAVVKRTDGVPLFAEELTRLMLEGGGHSATREIPATLHDSLMARLDRLGPAKEVAQIAAVIGREFNYELLQAVTPISENQLQTALEKLADAELIYANGVAPEAKYQFKHALIQDAAYEALLKSRRKELHRRVASTISEKFAAIADAQPEILARHWTDAGEADLAVAAWKKAADAADARRAFKEAEEGYHQALAMLYTLPETPERDARELVLASALVQVLHRTKGYTAPESVKAVAHARALAEKSGNLNGVILQLFATRSGAFVAADYPTTSALTDEILDLARREGSRTNLAFAHSGQLQVRFCRGDLIGVETHLAQLREFLDAPGLDQLPGAICAPLGFASMSAWVQGHPDLARQRLDQVFVIARDNKFELAMGRWFESWLYDWCGDWLRGEEAGKQSLAISDEHGFPYYAILSRCGLGLARARLGRTSEGVAMIRQSVSSLADIGARLGITFFLTCLAEAEALDGNIDDALGRIEDALQANPDELVFRPGAMIWRGKLRLKTGQLEAAEADFREAIALAQSMTGKAWELRASTDLARMLQARGDRAGARDLLAPVYNWFTEGLDTGDLRDARCLLEELH